MSKYNYDGGEKGKNHLFVIIDDDDNLVPIEYFGMIVSSRTEKSKFKYNESLNRNSKNNLKVDSIIKCDNVYKIPQKNIQCKIGQVDVDDYMRFMVVYNRALQEIENQLQKV